MARLFGNSPARLAGALAFAAMLLGMVSLSLAEDKPSTAPEITIRSITIEGAPRRKEAVKSQMRLREGESYDRDTFERLLNNDVKHLHRWGVWIKQVRPAVPRGEVDLVLVVNLRLRIARIRFEGMDEFDEEDIRPLLLVKPGSATDEPLLRLAADRLEEYYRDEGYRFARVTYEVEKGFGAGVQIVFDIEEGPRTRIDDIVFNGNRSISNHDLRAVMETSRSTFLEAERLEDRTFERDLAALEQYYREEGWRDARVTLEDLVYSDDREDLTIVIRVVEGERYRVRSVKIEGNEKIDTKTLMKEVKLRRGQYYRASVIYGNYDDEQKGDFKRIREIYGEEGYILVQTQVEEVFDEREKQVDVTYVIKEGEQITARRVVFRGNDKTRDDVIRRMVFVKPGEKFKLSALEASFAVLARAQYFGKVEPRFEDTGIPGLRDLVFDLEETRTGDIRFIAAYNQSTQFQGRIAVQFKNFDLSRLPRSFEDLMSGRAFAGGGQTLKLQVTAGMEKQVIYDLSFMEPHFFGTNFSFTFNAFNYQRDRGPYLETRYGANIVVGRRLTRWFSTSMRYRLEHVKLRDISTYAPQDVFDAAGPDWISSLTGTVSLDFVEKDSFSQPYDGLEASFSYEYAGGFMQGSVDFHKAQFNSTFYHTVFGRVSKWRHILAVRAKLGWAEPHTDATELPIYERFYLGGLGTVRGFGYREIGPKDRREPIGGNFMAVGGIEYSIPVYRAPMPQAWRQEIDVLRFILFYDVGVLSTNLEDYRTSMFRSAIGFGFRLRVPALGGIPIALDFGWPISRRPGDGTERVSFSLGFFFF